MELDAETQRLIGHLEAEVSNLKGQVAVMTAKLDTLIAFVEQTKGGWKTIALVAGVAGSAGAVIGKVFSFLPLRIG